MQSVMNSSQQGFSLCLLLSTSHDPTSKRPRYRFSPRPVIAHFWIRPSCNWIVFATSSETCENKTDEHTATEAETT